MKAAAASRAVQRQRGDQLRYLRTTRNRSTERPIVTRYTSLLGAVRARAAPTRELVLFYGFAKAYDVVKLRLTTRAKNRRAPR